MTSAVFALGPADMTEHDNVVCRVLDINGVEIARPKFAAVGYPMLAGLGRGHVDDAGQVVDHRGALDTGLQNGDRPGRPTRPEIKDMGLFQRRVADFKIGPASTAIHRGESPLHQRDVERYRVVFDWSGGHAVADCVG